MNLLFTLLTYLSKVDWSAYNRIELQKESDYDDADDAETTYVRVERLSRHSAYYFGGSLDSQSWLILTKKVTGRNEIENGSTSLEIFLSDPPLVWLFKISRFGERFRNGQYSLASLLFVVLLLMVPPRPVPSHWGHVPSCPTESAPLVTGTKNLNNPNILNKTSYPDLVASCETR